MALSTSGRGRLNESHKDTKQYLEEFDRLWKAAEAEKEQIEQSYGGATKDNYRAIAHYCGLVQKRLGKEVKELQEKYAYLFTE